MAQSRARLSNITNERSSLYIRIGIALTCVALARAFRSLSSRMLLRAFCTPLVKLRPTAAQQTILDSGERFTVAVTGGTATGWRWGRGPAILLVHGWAGRAAQLAAWVPKLTQRGFSVIAVDQPAHGESPGSTTNAVMMTHVLRSLTARTGPLAGVVAHSLGGLISSYAMSRGMETGSMVLVSAPAAPGPFFEHLMKMARIPAARQAEVMNGAEAILGATFDSLSTSSSWRHNGTPALIIHDRGDRQVPVAAAKENLESIPQAGFHQTEGLGHNRILADAGVVAAGVAFIESHSRSPYDRPLDAGLAAGLTSTGGTVEALVSTAEVMADLAYGQS